MRRIVKLKLSDRRDLIKVYDVGGPKGSAGGRIIDYEYTDSKGLLRWTPPKSGSYTFVNESRPQFNKVEYNIISDTGFGLPHGKGIS
jgi:hypothetical protein